MKKKGLGELRKLLVSGAEKLVEKEAEKLKKAVEEKMYGYVTPDKDSNVELLIAAGLLMHSGTTKGLYRREYYYTATQKGQEIYNLIYGKK